MLAAVAALALLAGGCGGKNKTSSKSAAAPQQRVKAALLNTQKINSGVVKLDATLSGGAMPGSMKITGGGKFDLKATGGPAFDLEVALDIAGQIQKIGFVVVDGKSFMKFGDRAFSMDEVKKGGTSATGDLGGIKPEQIRKMIESLNTYVTNFKQTGTQQVDGQTLTIYTAKVDVKQISATAQKEAGDKIPSVPGLGDLSSLTRMFRGTVVRVGIGEDDLPHSVGLETSIGASGTTGTGELAGTVKANILLTKINEPVTIKAPKNVVKGVDALGALGTMFGGMGSTMGGGATGTMGGSSGGR